MIIGIAGRISSGKRVLCNSLEKHGFRRLYFALPLKTLLVTLLHLPSIQRLDELKNEHRDYVFMDGDYAFIAKETGIPLSFIKDKMEHVKFTTIRQLLQYLGTDVIRAFNPDWHIEKIRQMINPYYNYVIDDLRFPNEKKFIEEMNGDTWYICRPKLDSVINHVSETSLSWQDFGYNIIINGGNLENLIFKWETFIQDYTDHMAHRLGVIESLKQEHIDVNTLADPFSTFDMFMLHKDQFTYTPKEWNMDDIKEFYLDKYNNLILIYKNETTEYIKNVLNIEDFKKLLKN